MWIRLSCEDTRAAFKKSAFTGTAFTGFMWTMGQNDAKHVCLPTKALPCGWPLNAKWSYTADLYSAAGAFSSSDSFRLAMPTTVSTTNPKILYYYLSHCFTSSSSSCSLAGGIQVSTATCCFGV